MSKPSPTLENSRLEIILLATAVFILVSLLAILILVCVSLKHSQSNSPLADHTDTHQTHYETSYYGTAWGGSWSERWDAGPLRTYQDNENSCLLVRRRSAPIEGDVRGEIANFENLIPLQIPDKEDGIYQTVADTPITPAMAPYVGSRVLEGINPDEPNRDASLSSASSTAREQTLGTATRRLEKTVNRDESFDLEAQDPEDLEP
ncbi:hypothetical protein E4U40_001071 [Claviceps sp. LM458 group G5]|nr:hypothetical protein E4U40_001071 [Claviceps sp. LM458 group G5]